MQTRLKRLLAEYAGRVVVHVGPKGQYPGTSGGREIGRGELHICFESNPFYHERFSKLRRISSRLNPIKRVLSFPRMFQEVKLPPHFADEIHLHNVLTDPNAMKLRDDKLRPSGPDQSRQLLEKARDSLKEDGEIYIAHTQTPNVFPKEDLKKLAAEVGLDVEFLAEHKRRTHITAEERALFEKHVGRKYGDVKSKWYLLYSGWFLAKLTKKKAS
ncbi:hypothetical protein HZC09_03405 [Candidatus Micrarchaeota archaeon]|nr:hypothetical protein [Candidatus Micrarchaeota archaeon]